MLSGETVVMYFKKSDSDHNESRLYKWMVRQAVENSEADSEIIHVATSDESTPDIELASFFIVCETSLKKRTDDIEERVRKFNPVKPIIILVPNNDSLQTFQRLASERVTVTTFKNYKQSIRSKARP